MKSGFICFLIMLVLSMLTISCVSQKDYDAVIKERDEVKAQVTSLQAEVTTIKADFDTLKSNQNNYKSNIKTISTRLTSEVKALAALNTLIFEGFLAGSDITKQASAGLKFLMDFDVAVKDIKNSQLAALYEELKSASLRQDIKGIQNKTASIMELVTKLVGDDIKALETAISKEY